MYELIENAPKTGSEPHDLGLAADHGVPEDRGPAGGGPVAAAPGAPPRPDDEDLPVAVPDPHGASPPSNPPARTRQGGALMYPSRFRYEAPRTARRGARAARASTATTPRCSPAARASCRCSSCASPPPRCSSTSTTCPASATTARTATARCASARCAATSTWSAPTLLPGKHPLMAVGGAAGRRPDRAQPRHARRARCATPTRRATGPSVMLALGGLDRRARPGRAAHDPGRRVRRRARSRTRCGPARSRSRPSCRPPRGHRRPAATSSSSAASATSPRRASPSPLETGAAAAVVRAGIALTGVGPDDDPGHRPPRTRWSAGR